MNAPDEDLRARLRALAEHEPLPTLSANERVLAQQGAEASLKVRGRRGLGLVLIGSLMLAGIVCWRVFEADSPSAVVEAPVVTPRTRCQPFQRRSIEEASLTDRATFAAVPSSEVAVSLSADCDILAELHTGSLFVHAANLQGRALRVSTPHGHVQVRGTIFAVHTTKDHLIVEVDEGLVEVSTSDRTVSLQAGQAVRIEARSLQQSSAPLPARNQLRTSVKLAPRAEKIVDAGEAPELVWRPGSIPTPSIPPEPKTSLTEDGRPMRKPQLTHGE